MDKKITRILGIVTAISLLITINISTPEITYANEIQVKERSISMLGREFIDNGDGAYVNNIENQKAIKMIGKEKHFIGKILIFSDKTTMLLSTDTNISITEKEVIGVQPLDTYIRSWGDSNRGGGEVHVNVPNLIAVGVCAAGAAAISRAITALGAGVPGPVIAAISSVFTAYCVQVLTNGIWFVYEDHPQIKLCRAGFQNGSEFYNAC